MNSLCIYFFLIYLFIEATQISLLFARIYINIIILHFVLEVLFQILHYKFTINFVL